MTFTFRRYKRLGVDSPLAGWSLVVGCVASIGTAVFVLISGALLSGNDLLAVAAILGGVLGVAVLLVLHAASRNSRFRSTLIPAAALVIRGARRLLRRPGGDLDEEIGTWTDKFASLRLHPSVWIQVCGLALANWLADAGVFAASIYAVGAAVPWQALLLVYGSGIVVRSLGITPGGLGLVESTLCLGLAGAGVHGDQALASVLLYRLFSFWMLTVAGWAVLLRLRGDRNLNVEGQPLTSASRSIQAPNHSRTLRAG